MQIFESIQAFQAYRHKCVGTVGFVPTMGNLHLGHQSLLKQAVTENDHSVLSIYVNPTQFDNCNDLNTYPRTLSADLALAEQAGVSAVLIPAQEAVYPDEYTYRVSETQLSQTMEGACRPGHFEGMLTIVLKLLNIVQADRAYFGEKDYQQLLLVKGLCEAFFLRTVIVACQTVREADGLAMSSRNSRLEPHERVLAPFLYRMLCDQSLTDAERVTALEQKGFKVEYLLAAMSRRFVAAQLGRVRLIDNVPLML